MLCVLQRGAATTVAHCGGNKHNKHSSVTGAATTVAHCGDSKHSNSCSKPYGFIITVLPQLLCLDATHIAATHVDMIPLLPSAPT